jgi:predicted nucleic acid-binding protein
MILADTSAWVEYLRDTDSSVCNAMDALLTGGLAVTEPVAMEVLAGARDESHLRDLRGLLGRAELIPCTSDDFLDAASLFRVCRQRGETVRKLIDCLIAAVALRAGIALLHHDSDYDVLARHTPLQLHST